MFKRCQRCKKQLKIKRYAKQRKYCPECAYEVKKKRAISNYLEKNKK